MGQLVDGIWKDEWYDTSKTGGAFKRSTAGFRNWITPDGSAGPSGKGGFKAETGRYHLYVSYACPWAHRTLIFRALKGLEDHLLSVGEILAQRLFRTRIALPDGWSRNYAGTMETPALGTNRGHRMKYAL